MSWTQRTDKRKGDKAHGITFFMLEREIPSDGRAGGPTIGVVAACKRARNLGRRKVVGARREVNRKRRSRSAGRSPLRADTGPEGGLLRCFALGGVRAAAVAASVPA